MKAYYLIPFAILFSCGPSKDELAALEKRKQDSIFKADSAAKTQLKVDSIEHVLDSLRIKQENDTRHFEMVKKLMQTGYTKEQAENSLFRMYDSLDQVNPSFKGSHPLR